MRLKCVSMILGAILVSSAGTVRAAEPVEAKTGRRLLEAEAKNILLFSYPTATLKGVDYDGYKELRGGFALVLTYRYESPFETNGYVTFSFEFDPSGRLTSFQCLNRSGLLKPGSTANFAIAVAREIIKSNPDIDPVWKAAVERAEAMKLLLLYLQYKQ